ncbi:MAG: hypothetical protein IAX21_03265 [Candidatus Bathyarchaeota archaeon]|nr:FUN14 domain-containing protein [Candidatus Bathyarchaeum tardum]WGM89969.1 MAG: FUN14 domain-containing protein [Candidatus Bathyarchaeum tardum]WNZ29893.1 MAG: hypothetical protein IAX21_03265 [Candidatus Bathyarchaeota archaeon]
MTSTLTESLAPIVFQLVLGGVGGFLIGYAIRKVLKIALIVGVVVFSLILLASANIINVDYTGLSETTTNILNAINPALSLITPLLAHVPFIASLVFGFILGFKRN